jgi:acyl-coenzyme A thioesterase PaaI-like protein
MVLQDWQKFYNLPFGKWIFSRLVWRFVPYTGSVKPSVLELKPGYAKLMVKDRKKIRNHLGSIHAAALMNMAEAVSGIAFNIGLPRNSKAILTHFSIEYVKKARGTLTAECECPIPSGTQEEEFMIESIVKDEAQDEVVRATATWRVRPAS